MKFLRRGLLLVAGVLCLAATLSAKPWWMRDAETNQNDFLPPDEAFRVSARVDGDLIRLNWVIADGYYLYRERMEVKAESPDLMVSPATFPSGTLKTDPYLGTQEIYTQQVEGTAAFTRSDAGAHPIEIRVTYQGCAEAGLCYPPINKVIFPTVGAPPAPEGTPNTMGANASDLADAGSTTPTATPPVTAGTGSPASAATARVTAGTRDAMAHPTAGIKVSAANTPAHPWEIYAILGGAGAFLLAGLVLRKGRRLSLPA